jgi:hypothetical protein
MAILTSRSETDNCLWSNNIAIPASLLLKLEQKVFLKVIEVGAVLTTRSSSLFDGGMHGSYMHTIMLETKELAQPRKRRRWQT